MTLRFTCALLGASALIACGTETEMPQCGAGTVEQSDGTCAPSPPLCGAGTVLQGNTCVPSGAAPDAGADAVVDVEPDAGADAPDAADTGPDAAEDAAGDVPPPPEPDLPTLPPCQPSCEGLECGDDGCGGTCGDCAAGTCNGGGKCVDPGWTCAPDAFGDGLACDCECGSADPDCALTTVTLTLGCDEGETCQSGACAPCQPQCGAGVECGPDGCGGDCGKCYDPAKPFCIDGLCEGECVPDCDDQECGPDGCGGVCGECGIGHQCVLDKCQALPADLSCEGKCGEVTAGGCSCAAACAGGGCCADKAAACPCAPSCEGKSCGGDGCGGSCGDCAAGQACTTAGQCVDSDPCSPDPCTAYGTCDAGLCVCQIGYAGADCGACAAGYVGYPSCKPDPCLNQNCSGAGTCDPSTGACTCEAGYTGKICGECVDPKAIWPDCDTPDPCYDVWCNGKGTCDPATSACVCQQGYSGATCEACADGVSTWPGCGLTCTSDLQCFDNVGCTVDTCDLATGQCSNLSCAYSQVIWNQLGAIPPNATQAAPFDFPIDAQTSVSFWRSNDWPLSSYSPGGPSVDGSFTAALLQDVSLGWEGAFTYLNIDVPPATPNNAGDLTFDFGEPATARGPTWRYVVGVAALGFAGTGPTHITFSRTLQELGKFDAFQTGAYATFDGINVLSAPAGPNTGLQFFALPEEADDVVLNIDDQGVVGPDTFGVWVGVVDIAVTICAGSGPTGLCVGNQCGDGIKAGDEACDDGGTATGDGCDAECKVEAGHVCAGAIKSYCAPPGGCATHAECADADPCTEDLCDLSTGQCTNEDTCPP